MTICASEAGTSISAPASQTAVVAGWGSGRTVHRAVRGGPRADGVLPVLTLIRYSTPATSR